MGRVGDYHLPDSARLETNRGERRIEGILFDGIADPHPNPLPGGEGINIRLPAMRVHGG